jgi:hypothetical protein
MPKKANRSAHFKNSLRMPRQTGIGKGFRSTYITAQRLAAIRTRPEKEATLPHFTAKQAADVDGQDRFKRNDGNLKTSSPPAPKMQQSLQNTAQFRIPAGSRAESFPIFILAIPQLESSGKTQGGSHFGISTGHSCWIDQGRLQSVPIIFPVK